MMLRDVQETLSRLVSVFRRRTLDEDFKEEFAAHLDLLTEKNEQSGLPRGEARRRAILQLGGLNATKDFHRDVRGLPPLDRFLDMLGALGRDMRHAIRSLARARVFTFVCVVSLGIGMGTVIGILILMRLFGNPSVINTENLVELLLRPQGPLIAQRGDADNDWSYPDFAALRDARTGTSISAWTVAQTVARVPTGGARRVSVMYVSANYFQTVGVTLARGAGFDAALDHDTTAPPVVIVSYEFWKNRLGSDPDILGKTITLDWTTHVVVGVAPEWFIGHLQEEAIAQLWVPLNRHPRFQADDSVRFNRNVEWLRIHGRLSPGVTIEQANAAVSAAMFGLAQQYPASNAYKSASVEPYHPHGAAAKTEFGFLRAMLWGIAGMVLLVVCLNTSGMMLVRSAMRERELSIRQAIGAGRGQLIRYLLCEALVLATLSGFLASVLVLGGVRTFVARAFGSVPPILRVDAGMLASCVGLCLVASLLFGLLPAIRFSRPNVVSALKEEIGGGSRRVGRVHRLAAAVQLGLAVPFLVAGGVLLDHVRTTATAELGFEPKGVIAAPVDLTNVADTEERTALLLRSARENLAQTRGVASVGVADGLPLDFRGRVIRISRLDDSTAASVRPTRVDEGYLTAMGIRLVRGRGFTTEDRAGAQLVGILAEPIAARLFPDNSALGQRISVTFGDRTSHVVTIVGVIEDLVGSQMSNPRGELLLPLAQHPASTVFLIARTGPGIEPAALAPAFRTVLHDINPDFEPILASRHPGYMSQLVTGEKLVGNSMDDMLTQSSHAAIGGGVALLLAALGIYGVIGFMLASRMREMAVRIALGASQTRVLRTIFVDIVKLVAPGVALGLIVAIVLVRTSYLSWYSLGRVEPLVYAVAVAITILVAIVAGLPSARRAASVEPIVAMRSE